MRTWVWVISVLLNWWCGLSGSSQFSYYFVVHYPRNWEQFLRWRGCEIIRKYRNETFAFRGVKCTLFKPVFDLQISSENITRPPGCPNRSKKSQMLFMKLEIIPWLLSWMGLTPRHGIPVQNWLTQNQNSAAKIFVMILRWTGVTLRIVSLIFNDVQSLFVKNYSVIGAISSWKILK